MAVALHLVARAVEVEHLLRQFVHAQQLVDRQLHELPRLGILLDATVHHLQAVAQVGDRIADLVRELRHQAAPTPPAVRAA